MHAVVVGVMTPTNDLLGVVPHPGGQPELSHPNTETLMFTLNERLLRGMSGRCFYSVWPDGGGPGSHSLDVCTC